MLWALGYGDHGRVDAKMMSRATAGHAASIGISGALSLACGDLIATTARWRATFFVAAASAAAAWLSARTSIENRTTSSTTAAEAVRYHTDCVGDRGACETRGAILAVIRPSAPVLCAM